MKKILLSLFLCLNGCLFFDANETSPSTPLPFDSDTGVADTGAPDSGAPLDQGTQCSSNTMCGMFGVCEDGVCECEPRTRLEKGQCRPICEPGCAINKFCKPNPASNTCECRPGFEPVGQECEVGRIVLNASREEYVVDTVNKKTFPLPAGVDANQVVPFLSARSTSNSHEGSLVSVSINAEGLTLNRSASDGKVTVIANLVEFDPIHVRVTSGKTSITQDNKIPNKMIPIPPNSSPDHLFLVFYEHYKGRVGNPPATQDFVSVRGEVTPSGIQFHRQKSDGTVSIEWFLVESIGNAFRVTHDNLDIKTDELRSDAIPGRQEQLFFWSAETKGKSKEESNASCSLDSNDEFICQRRDLTNTAGNNNRSKEKLRLSVQSVNFQNGMTIINPIANITMTTDKDVSAIPNFDAAMERDGLIYGQLGRAGATSISSFATGTTDPGNQSLCTVRFEDLGSGVNFIVEREGTGRTKVSLGSQWIRWN